MSNEAYALFLGPAFRLIGANDEWLAHRPMPEPLGVPLVELFPDNPTLPVVARAARDQGKCIETLAWLDGRAGMLMVCPFHREGRSGVATSFRPLDELTATA